MGEVVGQKYSVLKCQWFLFEKATEIGHLNTLNANPTKWSNTLKQFVGSSSVFDHFWGLALKGIKYGLLFFMYYFLLHLYV